MNRAEIKSLAKQQIKGKIGILFVIALIICAITTVASSIFGPYAGPVIATIIITPAFMLSQIRIFQNLAKGNAPKVSDAFGGFDDFWSAFKVNFLVGLFTYLWTLLFIIPGIIKGFSYSMAMFILAENKGMGAREAINRSKAMMHGHKMDMFVLELSFIGWMLLGMVTFGIAYIWIIPYMSATYINFYNKIKGVEATATEAAATEAAPEALPAENNETVENNETAE